VNINLFYKMAENGECFALF